MDTKPKSNIMHDEKRKKSDKVEWNGGKKNKDRRRRRDRKVSDGQPASKHGDNSHKKGSNDE